MVKDISKFYFTDEDFDVFHKDKAALNTSDVRTRRKIVQEKLLDFNKDVLYPMILSGNLNLTTHKATEHITSLAFPIVYNNYRVDWLGIRYGRNSADIAELQEIFKMHVDKKEKEQDKKYGFQKYACLQVNVCYTGIEVGLFHSTPVDAIDRMYMKEHIDDTEVQDAIIEEIRKLKGYGYIWSIGGGDEQHLFEVDAEKPEDFITFYKKYDKTGMWSMMLKHFPRYDDKVTEENLGQTCYDIIEQLKPLYELVIWKRGSNSGR